MVWHILSQERPSNRELGRPTHIGHCRFWCLCNAYDKLSSAHFNKHVWYVELHFESPSYHDVHMFYLYCLIVVCFDSTICQRVTRGFDSYLQHLQAQHMQKLQENFFCIDCDFGSSVGSLQPEYGGFDEPIEDIDETSTRTTVHQVVTVVDGQSDNEDNIAIGSDVDESPRLKSTVEQAERHEIHPMISCLATLQFQEIFVLSQRSDQPVLQTLDWFIEVRLL